MSLSKLIGDVYISTVWEEDNVFKLNDEVLLLYRSFVRPLLQALHNCSSCVVVPVKGELDWFKFPVAGYEINLPKLALNRLSDYVWKYGQVHDQVGTNGTLDHDISTALHICDVLVTYMKLHFKKSIDFKKEHFKNSLSATFAYWLGLVLADKWVGVMKYHLNYLFCEAEAKLDSHVEFPETPDSLFGSKKGTILLGSLNKILRRGLAQKLDRFSSKFLRWDLLQGVKRGMPSVSTATVTAAAEKHKGLLSLDRETPTEMLEEVDRKAESVLKPIRRRSFRYGDTLTDKACAENTRSKGGGLGQILKESGLDFCSAAIGQDNLLKMSYHPLLGTWEERFRIDVSNCIKMASPLSEPRERHTFVKFILEPLKVRTITKAPVTVNAVWKHVQEKLWKQMQLHEQFRLTGEQVTPKIIDDLECRTRAFFGERLGDGDKFFVGCPDYDRWVWTSGDYSAATDNLNSDVTLAMVNVLCKRDPELFFVMKRALSGARISYENAFPGIREPDDFDQTNGQLMGCVFSFPLLCWANLFCFWIALERYYKRSFRIEELPVLVNGDDILFKQPPAFNKVWEEVITSVGFLKSVGKNFVSAQFCTVNSCYYSFKQGSPTCYQVPHVGYGFIFGQKKGQSLDDKEAQNLTDKLSRINFRGLFCDYSWNSASERALSYLLETKNRLVGQSGRSRKGLGIPGKQTFAAVCMDRVLASYSPSANAASWDASNVCNTKYTQVLTRDPEPPEWDLVTRERGRVCKKFRKWDRMGFVARLEVKWSFRGKLLAGLKSTMLEKGGVGLGSWGRLVGLLRTPNSE